MPTFYMRKSTGKGATYIEQDCGYKTPCWIWQGACRQGYGQKSNPAYSRKIGTGAKMIGAHVYYYEQKYGPVPDGLVLDHLCEQRACVNPDHVEPKTHANNIRCGSMPLMSEDKVILLKADLASGMRQVDVASKYGISQPTVSQIARGVTWR